VAHPGDRLVVVNKDGIQHSLTAEATGDSGPLFDTDFIAKGGEGTIIAPAPGTYAFHCKRHASMTGTLKVE
jgi:plastocyanin